MGPGLPNATSCNQEMDDWFQGFKGKTYAQTQEIFKEKTYDYTVALKNQKEDGETEIKTAALKNDHIPRIINSRPEDPPEKRPFLKCTTPAKIFKSGMAASFIPITWNALNHKKVRHMLGEGGASKEIMVKQKETQKNYNQLKSEVIIVYVFWFLINKLSPFFSIYLL